MAKNQVTKPVSFRLPEDIIEKINEARFVRRKNTKVDVVREALEEYFERYNVVPKNEK